MVGVTWIAAKLFFKKVWLWLKTYWYIPAVLIYTIALWVLFRRNGAAALDVLRASKESYEAQIKVMEEAHAQEIEARDNALAQYELIIAAIEEEYAANRETLSRDKRKKIKEYIDKYGEDPEELARIIEEKFGIQFEPNE
tara:strand:- start:31 stop:450 length:420 start_codon:yes stop_codon:yes gene_type:complete